MEIVWLEGAKIDAENIVDYYTNNVGRDQAIKIVGKINEVLNLLSRHPLIGRYVEDTHTREFPVLGSSYKIIFANSESKIYVLRIFNTKQNPDKKFTK